MNRRAFGTLLLGSTAVRLAANPGRAPAFEPPDRPARPGRLIEFGWDEPDTAFLRQHLAEVERTPFDGCVFHVVATNEAGGKENFAWLGWGKRPFRAEALAPALADLRATPFGRFTHNFLRFNTTPADLDWFDDHAAVLNNARLAAQVAREGKCAGILLDVEEYQGPLFTYARQRDARSRSWAQYAAMARRRGREVMDAFQAGDAFPGLTVFLTFGYTLPWVESGQGRKPLAECRYGLLAPFLDGMVDAARGGSRIVDGFELSYGYRDPARFDEAYRMMRHDVLPIVAAPGRYAQVVSAGFGLWLDFEWRRRGWDATDPARNYFAPAAFEASVGHALARTDEYVWIYGETPRWWSDRGKSVALPEAYATALRRARDRNRR